ncbi:metalloregulator ArsR/SmtB family transcription factor [Paenibacillus sp. FSL R7-0337]|uniref:ArsR/SmtB family transcription factor n=1 Tax=unclassified Paenibacillus TaxID=185978 RepID=UPI00097015BB|nr:metalloregulator ArsR/SmtB family transcription factor [Paenibacillus sp. FSL R7-0337]OMF97080.1 transcriptional regulator [Paenibacillus sp. FSL R7-0337]
MNTMTFSALAEPTRLRMIEILKDGPMSVGDIAERLALRQPQASKHLRVLLEAGLVEVEAAANRRNYRLRTEPLKAMDAWLEAYRRLWSERFDNLDDYLRQLQSEEE